MQNPVLLDRRWVLDAGEVVLLDYFGSDKMIADTARVSYRKGTKQQSNDKQLIHYLYMNDHHSPFEHACFRFYIKAPLFVLQQILRHRTFKFNQSSARYSEMIEEAYVPLPEHITTQDFKNKQARTDKKVDNAQSVMTTIHAHNDLTFALYKELLHEDGVAREIARTVLPHGTYSEMIVTCDLRNFMHFLKLRMSPHAQYEVRVYAEAMHEMASALFPYTFAAFDNYELKSFKLSGRMQEALSLAVEAYENGSWSQFVQDVAGKFHWESSSEKDSFIKWATTLRKDKK